MQFDEMDCTILKPHGRLSFQLPPSAASECFKELPQFPNRAGHSDDFDLLDLADDFKIVTHGKQKLCGETAYQELRDSIVGLNLIMLAH